MSITFFTPRNIISTTVAAPRPAGAPSLVVADGSLISSPPPLAATVARSGAVLCVLQVTGRSGDTLTVSGAIEGTTDTDLIVGDQIQIRPMLPSLTEIHDAIFDIGLTPGPQGPAGPGVAAGGSSGQVLAKASSTDYDTHWVDPPVSSGTVTSVGLGLPAIFNVSGSPVATSGTLTATLATQAANCVWAGPATGADATPTFRALVAGDIPNIAESQVNGLAGDLSSLASSVATKAADSSVVHNTGNETIAGTKTFSSTIVANISGNAATATNVSGTVTVAHGGTGQVTASAAFNALSPITTLGDLIYGSGPNTAARLAGDTSNTRKFLRSLSSGSVATAPVWDTLVAGDIPTIAESQVANLTSDLAARAPLASPAFTGRPTYGGSTSGSTGLQASATASGTLTLPAATDTLVGRATTDTLTNKTIGPAGLAYAGATSGSTALAAAAVAGGTVTLPAATSVVASVLATTTTSATLSTKNTTATVLGKAVGAGLTLPANFFIAGRTIRFRAWGIATLTASSSSAALTFAAKLGSTTVATTAAFTPGAAASNASWTAEVALTCRTTGSTGTVFAQGRVEILPTTAPTVLGMPTTAAATIDTTAAQTFDFQVTESNGSGAQTVTCTNYTLEVLN